MRMLRPALLLLAATSGILVAAVAPTAAPARAAGSVPTVSIVAPSAGQTVTGGVDFTVSIDGVASTDPATVVDFAITSGSRYRKSQSIAVAADGCVPTCTVTAHFDTASLDTSSFQAAGPIADLPDGMASFAASVTSRSGSVTTATGQWLIDNHRPALALPNLDVYAPTGQQFWPGFNALNTQVDATSNATTGLPINTIRLVVLDGLQASALPTTAAAPAEGTGIVSFDLTGLPYTVWDAYVQAVDNAGVPSAALPVLLRRLPHAYSLSVDSGALHNDIPQLQGDAARITVTPNWTDGPSQTDTWLTAVQVQFDLQPVGEATGLHTTSSVTLDLRKADGTAFYAGQQQLTVCGVDNHGVQTCINPAVWIVLPISATWVVGTSRPDTPTTAMARFTNTTGSPIHSITLGMRLTPLAPPVLDPAGATPSASAPVTFTPGSNSLSAVVTLANGTTYTLWHEVISLVDVDTTIGAPKTAVWGTQTTFHAKALSWKGAAQPGLSVRLQSRASGSATWVSRAAATTNQYGAATMRVPSATTGSASWRVVSAQTKTRKASTSASRVVQVRAAFGRLPASGSTSVGRTVRYSVVIRPDTSGARVDIQYRRSGQTRWSTLTHRTVARHSTAIAVRLGRAGSYRIRLLVERTGTVVTTVSPSWRLTVAR